VSVFLYNYAHLSDNFMMIKDKNKPVIQLKSVTRDFFDGKQLRRVLQKTDLEIYPGELTILSGPSGSGKTTLLTIMALILSPSEGNILVQGNDVTGLSEDSLATMRLKYYGFVFQNAALINALSVIENILIASAVQGRSVSKETQQRAEVIMNRLGLTDYANINSEQLSGGQKQRVAIGRALINEPVIILCDEPTSALDVNNSKIVVETLKELSREGRGIVLVTHDPRVFPYGDRLIQVEDGQIVTDTGSQVII
jgi:ABC-type lipoprotein export system ATPase subunit